MAGEYYDVMTKHMAKIAERDDVHDVFAEARINYLNTIDYQHEGPKVGYIFKSFMELDDVELELLINHYKGESPKNLLSNYFCTDCQK